MPRQSLLIVAAQIGEGAIEPLKAMLETMTIVPGQADPANPIVPFGRIDNLHFARFILLEDPSLADRDGITDLPSKEPTRLALLVDGDGSAEELLQRLAAAAAPGLAKIFAHCDDAAAPDTIVDWMRSHQVRAAASYVNRPGRTAQQVREEAALHNVLLTTRLAHPDKTPEALWPLLRKAACAVTLTPVGSPRIGERFADFVHLISLPVLAILLSPLLLMASPALIVMLRRRETTDPVIAPRPSRGRNAMLSAIEDHDVTNQYSAIGSLKPGRFRLWIAVVILWVINWGSRHIYASGRLARVNTIHFASWTFLDDKRRILFVSNYDGSREAYNDDFINKVAFGLNLSFSNGLGYPRTDWLVFGGAWHEQDFKWYLFHHQIPPRSGTMRFAG